MKLLIVDDEKLTREGLSNSIIWKGLGINHIYEADDGLNGLYLVKKHKPDIILTDIRMPRVNGIELAEKVREILDNCSIIFMSGYSDKQYLKAAIKLNAINYIEKPINHNEVKEAIIKAIKNVNQNKLTQQTEDNRKKEEVAKLVHNLNYTNSESNYIDYQEQLSNLGFSIKSNTSCNTIIVKIIDSQDLLSNLNLRYIEEYISDYLRNSFEYKVSHIHAIKKNEFIVFHLFYDLKTSFKYILNVFHKLSAELLNICKFYVCIGERVVGIDHIHESYNTAVILLQNAFFQDINSVLVYKDIDDRKDSALMIPDDLDKTFELLLKTKDDEATRLFLDNIYKILKYSNNILVSTAKELYYKLLLKIEEAEESFHIPLQELPYEGHSLLKSVMACETIDELHSLIMSSTLYFFKQVKNTSGENINIVYIKEYVNKNYMDNNLSIKSISDFIQLSPSYACTIFKNETNQTLNQYITECRIDKSKRLLLDPRNRINDISYKVGYSDSNYFSKSFKKLVGHSPTEFREKNTK